MYKYFEEKLSDIYRKANGKKIVIWGWGLQGKIIYLWLKSKSREVEVIIDNGRPAIEAGWGKIKSSQILEYYDPSEVIILVTPLNNIKHIAKEITQYKYSEDNLVYVREYFYGSNNDRIVDYYTYLDYMYEGVNISQVGINDTPGYGIGNEADFHSYSPNIGMMLQYTLQMFSFNKSDAVFDFGCGKGGALTLFHKNGVGKIGGIEYDDSLYKTAVRNMKILNLTCHLAKGDAAQYKEIDDYNIFYFFDPFVGKTFELVINNIYDSYKKHNRRITIIYSAAREHTTILNYKVFKFTYQISNPFVFNGYTNIYICE